MAGEHYGSMINGDATQPPLASSVQEENSNSIFRELQPTPSIELRQNHAVSTSSSKVLARKRWNLTDADWMAQKERIYDLFIRKNLTLDETMSIMKEKWGFNASPKLFKDKLKVWGYAKYRKKNIIQKNLREAKSWQELETEIVAGIRKVEMDPILKAHSGMTASASDKENDSAAFQSSYHANSGKGDHAKPHGKCWSPFKMCARSQAVKQMAERDYGNAITNLQAALTGLQFLSAPPQAYVRSTAWSLSDAYVRTGDLGMADAVINWISATYIHDKGLWNPETLDHYLRVIDWLLESRRVHDGKCLGFMFYLACRDRYGPQQTIRIACNKYVENQMAEPPDKSVFDLLSRKSDDPIEVRQQLRLAKLWSTAGIEGIEEMLQSMVAVYNSYAAKSKSLGIFARCALIRHYVIMGSHDAATKECKESRDLLAAFIREFTLSELRDMLLLSRELAALHLQNQDPDRAKRVLTWTADTLQTLILVPSKLGDNSENTIRIAVGGVMPGYGLSGHTVCLYGV
ncbi:unnamed protein product [Clonostachys rhizophaga]|uniref:Clr5 domain-containing protein n=1 Tax=Clonostachys rhizophaga TaxID=160324 RepID=A0A9N9YKW6_9HYPO|nr:unnamed protein product [Clonostachys rhizophaga]